MTDSIAGQGADHWKRKYYDQLDRLDQKEAEWAKLETVLKRAIARLSLAAEGHYPAVDRQIYNIRTAIREQVNGPKLDAILDDLSDLLAHMEEKQAAPDRQVMAPLHTLLQSLTFPASCEKSAKNLVKKLHKSTDQDLDGLLPKLVDLLKQAMAAGSPADSGVRSGLFGRLLGASSGNDETLAQAAPDALSDIAALVRGLPWPAELEEPAAAAADRMCNADNDGAMQQAIRTLQALTAQWKREYPHVSQAAPPRGTVDGGDSEVRLYREYLLSFLDRLDDPGSPNGRLAAFRAVARDAVERQQLDDLAVDLAAMLSVPLHHETESPEAGVQPPSPQPSIQEMLIRLLEQLMVPADLVDDVDRMKARLETESEPGDWTVLLRDLAALINSIRSRMQKEKHEFEDFLQQITGRLNEMDAFLQIETHSLQDAEKKGHDFDVQMTTQVSDIRQDVTRATDLPELKQFLESRIEVIGQHIRDYRTEEDRRLQDARHNVAEMQSRMVSLEQEARNLKNIIAEKNKQALFDALTGIPNRLAYDRKVAEEIARWKRFGHPLSLAVWDVDYFKTVNDTFGHKAGDKVLRTIAQLLYDRIRETDFIARYGGEEFVMLLPGTPEEETLALLDELREKVATCGFHYHGDPVSITVSCGVSCFGENDTLEDVFERADQALYRAKDQGRNRCVIATC